MPTDPNPPVEILDTTFVQGQDGPASSGTAAEYVEKDTTVTGAGPGTANVDEVTTFDTEYAQGGEPRSDFTIDLEETLETSQISEPYLSFRADPAYSAPTQQPGVSIFDSSSTLTAPTSGAALNRTVDSFGTQDSYSIAAIPVPDTNVPDQPDSPYIWGTYRGVVVYWNPVADVEGAPVLGYTVRLSDGTTHRFGRDAWITSWFVPYLGVVESQSSVEVTATIEAFNSNGVGPRSGESNSAVPFNADETGYGMQSASLRDIYEGIHNIDGTVRYGTGAPTAPKNVTAVTPAADQIYVSWAPSQLGAGGSSIFGYYLIVTDENNSYWGDWFVYGDNFFLIESIDSGKKWNFYVVASNNEGLYGNYAKGEFIPVNNDEFGHAIILSPGFNSVVGNNTDYTVAPYEPHYNDYDFGSAWYVWTAPQTFYTYESTNFNTNDWEDNSFDTVLMICTGPNVQNLEVIETDDDGGIGAYSNIDFYPEPGVTYYIRIAGYNEGNSGRFVLNGPRYPSKPTITYTEAGNGSIYFEWSDPSDLGNPEYLAYVVNVYIDGVIQEDFSYQYPIYGNDFTIGGLDNGTAYTVRVGAVSNLALFNSPNTVLSDPSDPVTPST